MEIKDYEYIEYLLLNYGTEGVVRGVARAMKKHADKMSDLGLKEKAKESIEMSECLKDLLAE